MEQNGLVGLPDEIQKLIFSEGKLNDFDAIMLRAASKSLFKLVQKLHPFPKHYVLDQNDCASYFARIGSVSCLEYLQKSLNFFLTTDHADTAAASNQFDALIYLQKNGCRIDWTTAHQAVRAGNLEMLKYCLQICDIEKDINDRASLFSVTSREGQLHILKYLRENGYDWSSDCAVEASCYNHLECFKYIINNGFYVEEEAKVAINSIEMVQFLEQKGFDWKWTACEQAGSNLELLRYIHEREPPAPWGLAVDNAISNGYLDCLKYMIENGAQVERPVAKVGSLDVLKFLVEHTNAVFLPGIYLRAAEKVQKDVLEYLPKIRGLQRPNNLGTFAAESGDLNFFKWCIEEQHYGTDIKNYAEGYSDDILEVALDALNLDLVKYVIEKNLQPRLRTHREYAQRVGMNIDILKYMYKIEPFGITQPMVNEAISAGNIEVLEWMHQHGVKFNASHVVLAIQARKLTTMAYLLKTGVKFSIGCQQGNLLCYKYAHDHGYPWSKDAVNLIGNYPDLLRYMVHCGQVTLSLELYKKFQSKGCSSVLEYLKQSGVTPPPEKTESTINSVIHSVFDIFRK